MALILVAGAMAGFYFSGRVGTGTGHSTETAESAEPFSVGEEVLTVAQGFDYEVTEGDELAYRVRAERLISDVQDRMDLEQMEVELPQEEGGSVVIVANRGSVHLDSKSADLEGSVRARTSDGVELTGEGFEVIREGKQLISTGPVEFGKNGEYSGSAQRLHYAIKKERLTLEGRVVIRTAAGADSEAGSLRCQKLVYDRLQGTLRLEGEVRVKRGQEFLDAGRLSLTLGPTENEIRSVRAESGVRGRYLPEPANEELESRLDFKGKLLYAVFEEGTGLAKQAELRARKEHTVKLDMIDVSGLSRVLTASVVNAEFERGEIATADALDPVVLVERHSFAPARLLRRVCSEHARVVFDELGEMERLTLKGNVDYQTTDMQAYGDRIVADSTDQGVTIVGRPARVVNTSGNLTAPKITYSDLGSIVATQGVRAEFIRGSGYTLMGSTSDEPVQITAREARWEEQPESIEFRGSVRAWQGEDYLLAEKVVGEPEHDRLTATENVKTVLKRDSGGLGSADSDAGRGEPIEITAEKLIYEQPRRVITYEGEVRALQATRVLECDSLDVELDENDDVERLVCVGELLVEDPAQGKEVRGDEAIYLPGADEVDITGDPVILTDQDGTELRGGRIVYHFDTGAAQIHSRPVADGEAGKTG